MARGDRCLFLPARGAEQGQAAIIAVTLLSLVAVLLAAGVAVGSLVIQREQLRAAAATAAAAYAHGADAPLEQARLVARANGADGLRIRQPAGLSGAGQGTSDASSAGEPSPSAPSDGDHVTVGALRVEVHAAPRGAGRALAAGRVLRADAEVPPGPIMAGSLASGASATLAGAGGAYAGPLVHVDGVPICPAVGARYRAMQAAAAAAGIRLTATSGYRTMAQQAALYQALGPAIAAPPGRSLHHAATELDIAVGPAGSATHRWLQAHGPAFGFIQRYSWEPWHWGNVHGCSPSGSA